MFQDDWSLFQDDWYSMSREITSLFELYVGRDKDKDSKIKQFLELVTSRNPRMPDLEILAEGSPILQSAIEFMRLADRFSRSEDVKGHKTVRSSGAASPSASAFVKPPACHRGS